MIQVKKLVDTFHENQQLRNSIYLLLGSLATAGFGFIFWIIAARLFNAPTVGVATVLISLSSLISLLSLAGFDSSFVRFLPKSADKNAYTNSGIIVTTVLSTVFSVVFLGFSYLTTPELRTVLSEPLVVILFVLLTIGSSLNLLTNSVFLAHRQAGYIFFINTIFNVIKVILPFCFIAYGAVGIFVAAGVAQVVGLAISLYYMHTRYDYRPRLTIDTVALRQTFSYTSSIYIGSVLNLLPPTLLPLVITQRLDSASTAYYYMAFNIATIIFTIAYSAMQSAFAESSHDEAALRKNVVKGFKISFALTLPAIVMSVALGSYVLGVFGTEYAASASQLLSIMSISAIFVIAYSALGAVLKIAHDTKSFIAMNAVYAVIIVGASFAFMPTYGLNAIGYAWLCGNVAAVALGAAMHLVFRRRRGIG